MGFQVDLSEIDVEKVDQGGRPLPGKCQLLITNVDDTKDGFVSIEHEIVAHEKKSEIGKTSYNSFGLDGKSAKRTLLFLIATGQTTKEDAAASGGALDGNSEDLIGKVYFAKLEVSTYNGKEKCRAEWEIWGPTDERCAGYPFDPKITPANSPARKSPTSGGGEKPKGKTTASKKVEPKDDGVAVAVESDIPF